MIGWPVSCVERDREQWLTEWENKWGKIWEAGERKKGKRGRGGGERWKKVRGSVIKGAGIRDPCPPLF